MRLFIKAIIKKIKPIYNFYLYQLNLRRRIIEKLTISDYSVKRRMILKMAQKYNCSQVFIETGTYMGDTIDFLKNHFNKLISIELSSELAERASARFEGIINTEIVNGDSAKILSSIISSIDTPILFWLDGHYSSEFWAENQYVITAKGEKVTPIIEELNQIKDHFIKRHIILIDDARLFNGIDYPTLMEVRSYVREYFPNYKFKVKKDIIHIMPI